MAAWHFYILSTSRIDQELGDQHSVGIKKIESMAAALPYAKVPYAKVREAVDSELASHR
jgi:hypothetical protein